MATGSAVISGTADSSSLQRLDGSKEFNSGKCGFPRYSGDAQAESSNSGISQFSGVTPPAKRSVAPAGRLGLSSRKLRFSLSGESSLFTLFGTVSLDVCNLLNQMHEAFCGPGVEKHHFQLRTWFIILIVILIQAWQPDPRKDKSPLEQTIAYMEKNFSANLSLAELARRTKMSRNQFIYKFRGKMGTTPCRYLIDLRLKHACVLLEKQEMSTEEIAFACGFCDGNYLRKIYRRRFGTPVNRRTTNSKKALRFRAETREAEKD